MQRLRLIFAKTAAMKYTGHLDLHKTWERTLRRARLPLAYSQGFNPQPKIQLASALPLGFTSECEVMDVWLEVVRDLAEVRAALEGALPPGLQLMALSEAPERAPALQTQVTTAEFQVTLPTTVTASDLDERIHALLEQTSVRRVRRDKEYDLRPLIEALERATSTAHHHELTMRLTAREGATGRPEEVVEALGLKASEARFHRKRLGLREA